MVLHCVTSFDLYNSQTKVRYSEVIQIYVCYLLKHITETKFHGLKVVPLEKWEYKTAT